MFTECRAAGRMAALPPEAVAAPALKETPRRKWNDYLVNFPRSEEDFRVHMRCPHCNDVFEMPNIPKGNPVKCQKCKRIFANHPTLEARPRAERIDTRLPCEVEGANGKLVDVSKSGLGVDAPQLNAAPGHSVIVRVAIPGSIEPLAFTTKVVRRIREGRWALRITRVNDPRRFQRFLRTRAAAARIAERLRGSS